MTDLDEPTETDDIAAEPEPGRERMTLAPMWVIHLLVGLGALIGVVSSVEVWTQRQVLDTNQWVELADDLLEDDAVRERVAVFLVDELYASVDVTAELESRLPEGFEGLAGVVASAVRDPITSGVDRVLASDAAAEIWRTANRVSHETFVAVLREEPVAGLSTEDGAVVLDLVGLVRSIGEDFGLSGDVLDRLPEGTGQIVIFESGELAAAQDAVAFLDVLGVVLYVLTLGCFIGAIVLAGARRRQVIGEVGAAVFVASFLILVVIRVVINTVDRSVDSAGKDAFRSVSAISTELLRGIAQVGLVWGLLLMLYALLAGPSRVAVSGRRRAGPLLVGRPGIAALIGVVVFLGLVYLLPSTPFGSWLRALFFVAVFVAAAVALRNQMADELRSGGDTADPDASDTADDAADELVS